jgi:ferric enterobactin receptor
VYFDASTLGCFMFALPLSGYMNRFVGAALLVLGSISAFAQAKLSVSITGEVVDSLTVKPVGYATIAVTDKVTGKAVNGALTDDDGTFEVSGVAPGNYAISVEFIGYQKMTLDVAVSDKDVALGTVVLAPTAHALKDVVITASSPVVENKVDRMIYNVANDITSQGGAAIDVLQKVPQVTVDIDGNVELQGNSDIAFLINGKPSSIFGNSLTDALASIPASQIKSIEVITSPGASYGAGGTAGIINIILKDSKAQGFNGTVNLAGGSLFQSGSVNLNYRHGNWGLHAFVNGSAKLKARTLGLQSRQSWDSVEKTNTTLLQYAYSDAVRHGGDAGLSFDWDISKRDNLTASFTTNYFYSGSSGVTQVQQSDYTETGAPLANTNSARYQDGHATNNAYDWSLGYKKTFRREGQQLSFLYNASYGQPYSAYQQYQTYSGQSMPFSGGQSSNPGVDYGTDLSLDYAHPVTTDCSLEAGIKASFHGISSRASVNTLDPSTDVYYYDNAQSYLLNYQQNIYAGYLLANFSCFHQLLKVKAGARFEYTNTRIDYAGVTIPDYGILAPSLIFSHNFNDNEFVKLSYVRRLERPGYGEINPFLNRSDPYNVATGNPNLRPEIGDNFELGYSHPAGNGASLYIAVFERINSHDIKPYTQFYPAYKIGDSVYNNVSVSSRANVGFEYNSGISISGSATVLRRLKCRGNIMVDNRYIVDNLDGGKTVNGIDERLSVNADYELPHDLVLEAFCQYRSPFNSIQGRTAQYFTYLFAFRKQWMNKKLSLGATIINPFDAYVRSTVTISTSDYNAYFFRKVPYRSISVNIMYKFGRLAFKKEKEDESGAAVPEG